MMTRKLMSLQINGYSFHLYADPQYLKEWREAGISIDLVENVIPEWIVDFGLTKPFVFLQNIFNFKNPWRKK